MKVSGKKGKVRKIGRRLSTGDRGCEFVQYFKGRFGQLYRPGMVNLKKGEVQWGKRMKTVQKLTCSCEKYPHFSRCFLRGKAIEAPVRHRGSTSV